MKLPVKVSLWYVIIGMAYIAISDIVLSTMHGHSWSIDADILMASILKGWIFIIVTGITLYLVLRFYIRKRDEQRQLLNTVVNHSRDLVWLIDDNKMVLTANEAFIQSVMKDSLEKIRLQNVLDLSTNDDERQFWEKCYDRVLKGEEFHFDRKIGAGDGVSFCEISLYPVTNSRGVIEKVACFAHDITALKLVQQEIEQQNKILKEINWIQSHEIRKPVANILGLLDIMESPESDQDEKEKVIGQIREQSVALDRLIHQVVHKASKID